MRYFDNYVTIALLIAYLTKIIMFSATVSDALIIIALSALYGYKLYLNSKTIPDPTKEIKDEVEQIKNSVNMVKLNMGVKSDKTPFKF